MDLAKSIGDREQRLGGQHGRWKCFGHKITSVIDRRSNGQSHIRLANAIGQRIHSQPLFSSLLLTVRAGASGAAVARFEADLLAMPAHISTIRSWSLARVVGDSPWTHVWEQEFAEVTGLTGAYLGHPHHWAVVDGWFDPEMPDRVVEPVLAHLFGERAPSLCTLLGD